MLSVHTGTTMIRKQGYGTIQSDDISFDAAADPSAPTENDGTVRRRWVMCWVALFLIVIIASIAAGVASNSSAQCAAQSCTLTSDMQGLLDAHNADRELHAAPALTWDQGLANDASAWVVQCLWQHQVQSTEGENLYTCNGPTTTLADGIGQATPAWYAEISQYSYANPGFSEATGHFTQVVWKGTTKVGCAATTCNPLSGETGKSIFVSCRYSPPGNVIGSFPANVL